MLVLTAFGLALAAYVFDLDDIFEGRKINFLVVRRLFCVTVASAPPLWQTLAQGVTGTFAASSIRCLSAQQVGDWGRNGQFNQSLVAAAMAQEAKRSKPLFVISTGIDSSASDVHETHL